VTISLPDVNVWVAIAAGGHVHHLPANDWFAAQPGASVAFCRVTQAGMLRLLTNSSAMNGAPKTIEQVWDISDRLRSDHRIIFAEEPDGLEPLWKKLMTQRGVGPSSWTDAYLAAFAGKQPFSLVTFDHGLRRWTEVALNVLGEPG